MKGSLKQYFRLVATSDACWKLLSPFVSRMNSLQDYRQILKSGEAIRNARFEKLLGPPVVQTGPFKGMKYPDFTAHCSSIFPKVIGSYELELRPVVEKLLEKGYKRIIDVGCAEGYYAVGFALRLPAVKVFAYDINPKAQASCKMMSVLNGVEGRVIVNAYCSPDTLRDFDFSEPTLIVCDCEGFEKELFSKENLPNLKNADLLIETHDLIDIEISDYLKELFRDTHTVTSVKSISDIEKARTYPYYPAVPLADRKHLFGEGRSDIMEWLILERRLP